MQPTDLDLGKISIRQHSHMTSHCTIRTTLNSTLEGWLSNAGTVEQESGRMRLQACAVVQERSICLLSQIL
jgi:hypothetical protein